MKAWQIIVAMLIVLTLSGCGNWFQKDPPSLVPNLETGKTLAETSATIETNTTTIKEEVQTVKEQATSVQGNASEVSTKVPAEARPTVDPYLEKIKGSATEILTSANKIETSANNIAGTKGQLEEAGKDVETLTTLVDDLQKERDAAIEEKDKAIADRDSSMHRLLQWLIVGCIILAVIFGALFVFYGSKAGLMAAAVCGTICAVAAFVDAYFVYLAIGGGVVLIGCIALAAWQIYIRQKALAEVVDTVEVAQDNMDPAKKTALFGGEGETGIMDTLQSQSTMALVKGMKEKMSNLWYYAKKKNGNGTNGSSGASTSGSS